MVTVFKARGCTFRTVSSSFCSLICSVLALEEVVWSLFKVLAFSPRSFSRLGMIEERREVSYEFVVWGRVRCEGVCGLSVWSVRVYVVCGACMCGVGVCMVWMCEVRGMYDMKVQMLYKKIVVDIPHPSLAWAQLVFFVFPSALVIPCSSWGAKLGCFCWVYLKAGEWKEQMCIYRAIMCIYRAIGLSWWAYGANSINILYKEWPLTTLMVRSNSSWVLNPLEQAGHTLFSWIFSRDFLKKLCDPLTVEISLLDEQYSKYISSQWMLVL